MATLDEIFASMPEETANGTHELLIIDADTRAIYVPDIEAIFGVENDGGAETKYFQCPRYVGNGLDLAACFLRINFQNANGDRDSYLVADATVNGESIFFSWELSHKVTQYKGTVQFVLCASLPGSTKTTDWHSTLAAGRALEGLEPDAALAEAAASDVIAQLLALVAAQSENVEAVGAAQVAAVKNEGTTQTEAVKTAAEEAQAAAVAEIEAKGVNTRASIPADYTALGAAVDALERGTAPGIVCAAEGEAIVLHDASNKHLRSLRIFGKSTQDGVPTPDAPVEIVSLPAPVVTVCGKNLLKNEAKTSTKNGITFTVNDDGSVTCSGTATGTASFTVAGEFVLPPGDYVLSGCPENGGGSTYKLQINYKNEDGTQSGYPEGGTGRTFTFDRVTTVASVFIVVSEGLTMDKKVFYPMIQLAADADGMYKPHTGQTLTLANGLPGIPVTSGGNYTDANGQQWICDEVDLGRGVYVQRLKAKMCTGADTEAWDYISSNGVQNTGVFRLSISDIKANRDSTGRATMCNSYKHATNLPISNLEYWGNSTYFGLRQVAFENDSYTTVDGWKAYLASNPIELVYEIANPVETPLSEVELAAWRALRSYKPNTTLLNNAGAWMAAEYVADTKLYIDNLVAALIAAKNT